LDNIKQVTSLAVLYRKLLVYTSIAYYTVALYVFKIFISNWASTGNENNLCTSQSRARLV